MGVAWRTHQGASTYEVSKLFTLGRDIIRTNAHTKFHEDWTKTGTSGVLTRFHFKLIVLKTFHEDSTKNVTSRLLTRENCPAFWRTNVLTKAHEDWAINMALRVFTMLMLTTNNGQKRSQKLLMSAF
ncbi:hypothetical protein DPMN_134128 [Dreissena polymorpha]|uniref:Uncharacterized protein n=1 Tax=Dreissena polymorpha TaxID=45954 RepID=A0A9D4JDK1_DREPO|nr:hypothetical protein DPMN_134128 [Dreissena polymorpha]